MRLQVFSNAPFVRLFLGIKKDFRFAAYAQAKVCKSLEIKGFSIFRLN